MAKNEVRISITGDASDFKRAAGDAERVLGGFTGKVSGMGGRLSGAFSSFAGNLGALGAVAGLDAVVDLGSQAVAEAEEAERVSRVTAQLVKQTGADAWTTAGQIDALAESLSRKVAVDDELIAQGANVLLTFKNVRNAAGEGNDIFNRATRAGLDLSAVMGGDLTGANKMLGKALQDPLKGMTALTRAGVSFSQQQKDQVKALVESGDMLGAQKLILAELESQVGGTAEANATATDKMRVMWANLQEQLGKKLLPIVEKVGNWLADKLPDAIDFLGRAWARVWPVVQGVWDSVGQPVFDKVRDGVEAIAGLFSGGGGSKMAGGFSKVLNGLKSVWDSVGRPLIRLVTTAFDQIREWWDEHGPMIVGRMQEIFNKIGPLISKVAELIGTVLGWIATLWRNYGDEFLTIITGIWDAIYGVISAAMDVIMGVIDVVLGIIQGDWSRVWDGLKGIVGGVWDAIVAIIRGAWGILRGIFSAIAQFVGDVLGGAWRGLLAVVRFVWDAHVAVVRTAWDTLVGIFNAVVSWVGGKLTAVWDGLQSTVSTVWRTITTVISVAWTAIRAVFTSIGNGVSAVVGSFTSIPGRIVAAFSGLATAIAAPFRNAFNTIARMWNNTIGKLSVSIPFIGLKIDVPDIPTFHSGGVFNSGKGEGLALLKDGETVRTVAQELALQRRLTPPRTPADRNVTVRFEFGPGSIVTQARDADELLRDLMANPAGRNALRQAVVLVG